MTDSDTAIALHRLVLSSNLVWPNANVFDRSPTLKANIASLLAHAIGHADVEFMHAAIEDPDLPVSPVHVVAFTERTVVVIDGAGLMASATILRRNALRSATLVRVPNLVSGDWSAASTLRVELDYGPALDHAVLLGHDLQTPKNVTELVAFWPELQADLV
ncbi:hypothetical protein EDF31_102182 [Curtobacterium sp. PhB142]|uniref:hypothetical protein n=1 Tax=unclassified Curtobacterium TaxID=257496 RepID=UPI0010490EAE|nr:MULTISPECIES: hypothetical protein [unclassified Curtobacterium]TCL87483.1 hypothetical protein EDF31_102182 [Curtobacterium sp. PhB142]TCM05168.1 hypothetical protein EDF26_101397 [Curtobacterium sp. PhB134]